LRNINLMPLFSVPLYSEDLNIKFDKTILDSLEYIHTVSKDAYATKNKHILTTDERFESIRDSILNSVNIFTRNILHVDPNIEFYLTTSWITKHNPGDWVNSHYHPNSIISGVLYLQTDDSTGNIVFSNEVAKTFSAILQLDFKEFNIYNSNSWSISPKENQLLLFPSTLLHEVKPNNSNIIRYSLSFNLFVRGSFGLAVNEPELVL
jgi:uncharacterized protein (TIGR02466 family)